MTFEDESAFGTHICSGRVRRHIRSWPEAARIGPAEHVRFARQVQTSTCSAIASASLTSIPRYRTVLSILVCPRISCTGRKLPMRL